MTDYSRMKEDLNLIRENHIRINLLVCQLKTLRDD